MIHNRTDFYFSGNSLPWSSADMPRLIAVIDAWLACSVKIYREGFELMMALSRCRGFNSQYATLATRQIERYLKIIMKHNRDLERSWRRDPVNPQPGPVLVCEFRQPTLDEDGVPTTAEGPAVTACSSDKEITALVCRHYQQMHAILKADPRAHADDIARAASLALFEKEQDVKSVSVPEVEIMQQSEQPIEKVEQQSDSDKSSEPSIDVENEPAESSSDKPFRYRRRRFTKQ